MQPALATLLLTLAGAALAGGLGWGAAGLAHRREERRRQRLHPWMEPVEHRGAE